MKITTLQPGMVTNLQLLAMVNMFVKILGKGRNAIDIMEVTQPLQHGECLIIIAIIMVVQRMIIPKN